MVIVSTPTKSLKGTFSVPGDKSISHRALILGGLAIGQTEIQNILEADDVIQTAEALEAMGTIVDRNVGQKTWCITGRGIGGLREPKNVLDLKNSGTGVRLLMGLVSTHPIQVHFTGDSSLRSRPMGRISFPIQKMGAQVIAREKNWLPLTIIGTKYPMPITYELPIPSAQVKSAILLAGLNAPGETTVIENYPSRDHTELMLRHFGAKITIEDKTNTRRLITLLGQPELEAQKLKIPGDPSSAAFPIVAALITPNSKITLKNVGINPLRTGLLETLLEMGGRIQIRNKRKKAGEAVGDLIVESSELKGVVIPPTRAPSMIDEFPILSIAAAKAKGTTQMLGLSELRLKESDRLSAIAEGLKICGTQVKIEKNNLIVRGAEKIIPNDAEIKTQMDHRIAMSFLIMGMAANSPIHIDDGDFIKSSFPNFIDNMNKLGGKISKKV